MFPIHRPPLRCAFFKLMFIHHPPPALLYSDYNISGDALSNFNFIEFAVDIAVILVSAGPRWRMARCLMARREGGGMAMRGGVVHGLKKFSEETNAILQGLDNFAESLIQNTFFGAT